MRSVFSMEPDGMTRAWPIEALISKKMRMTQNHARASRRTFCSVVRWSSGFTGLEFLVFMRHRDRAVGLDGRGILHAGIFQKLAIRTALANFELHEVGEINTRITRRTKVTFGVADGLFQAVERDVAKRIGAEKFADFLRRVARGDEFFARGRVHAVVARGNSGRTGDAHVDFGCAGF